MGRGQQINKTNNGDYSGEYNTTRDFSAKKPSVGVPLL
jgi:hypothetical protein